MIDDSNSSGSNDRRRSRSYSGGRRYQRKPRYCIFCSDKTLELDYKNYSLLRKFITEEGKIRPRRQTGACAKHQRGVAREIKRARHIALLPYTGETWEESIR